MKARFEVSTAGMRELQSGREPWQLSKELVSNAFDETATLCEVYIKSTAPRKALLSVYDNGSGFTNIKDAWTLMGHTPKRLDPTVRGRFNIGEKEILSIAISAIIYTSGKIISFPKTGGRQVRNNPKPFTGTRVDCILPWGNRQVETVIANLKTLLTPKEVTYTVNGETISYREPAQIVETTLDTVLQDRINEPMRATRRKTTLELYPAESGMLYEMGIPIQSIECPYLVNVAQKVPLPPNRDVVRDSYLQDIYTTILNATAENLGDEQVSSTWVRLGVEDKDVEPEAVKAVMNKRYGNRVALWSTDQRSNERALESGYELVHGRTLSSAERQTMESAGLQHSSSIFPTNWGEAEDVPESEWTDGMKRVVAYTKRLSKGLLGYAVSVSMYKMVRCEVVADFSSGLLRFNIGRLGKAWFDKITPRTTSLLLHEFAHTVGNGHNWQYNKELEKLAGKAVHLALEKPEIFEKGEENGEKM